MNSTRQVSLGMPSFLDSLAKKWRPLVPAARLTVDNNQDFTAWLLNPLTRWSLAAFGEEVFDDAAKGYARYCMEVGRRQQIYEQTGLFASESIADIKSRVYDDEGYMLPYMWAAVLIYAFWPSMVNHIGLFRDHFVKELPQHADVLELASGHGVLSLLAAEQRPDVRVTGIDVSSPAIEFAQRLLAPSGHADRVVFQLGDALSPALLNARKYSGVISAMLAEHLEDPQRLFHVVAGCLADDGIAFVSIAIESAQRDHIYEFHNESEPIRMAENAGLRVRRLICDASATNVGSRFVPRALALILQRR